MTRTRPDLPADPTGSADTRRAVLLAVIWTALILGFFLRGWGDDLQAVWLAGHFWATHRPDLIYAEPDGFFGGTPPAWQPTLDAMGLGDMVAFPYVYPPLWAVLAAPLTAVLSPAAFANAVLLVQVPLLAVSAFLAARLFRPASMSLSGYVGLCFAILSTSQPGLLAVFLNQPSITVIFLILLSADRLRIDRPVAAGIALGFAAAIKIWPAVFVILFLARRSWRATAAFALTGAALAALSLILAGPDLHRAFLKSAHDLAGVVLVSSNNISARSVLMLADALWRGDTALLGDVQSNVTRAPPLWVTALPTLAFAAGLAALARTVRCHAPADRLPVALLALGIMLPILGPVGWQHYYLLPLLLVPGLPARVGLRRALPPLGFLAVILFFPALILSGGRPYGQTVHVALAVTAWLAVLAAVLRAPPDRS